MATVWSQEARRFVPVVSSGEKYREAHELQLIVADVRRLERHGSDSDMQKAKKLRKLYPHLRFD